MSLWHLTTLVIVVALVVAAVAAVGLVVRALSRRRDD